MMGNCIPWGSECKYVLTLSSLSDNQIELVQGLTATRHQWTVQESSIKLLYPKMELLILHSNHHFLEHYFHLTKQQKYPNNLWDNSPKHENVQSDVGQRSGSRDYNVVQVALAKIWTSPIFSRHCTLLWYAISVEKENLMHQFFWHSISTLSFLSIGITLLTAPYEF